MTEHEIASREAWLVARAELQEAEKRLTRAGDEVARLRRQLPWVAVTKPYVLQTREGRRTLAELFDGRSQLMVYHFMFGAGFRDGCPTNSSIADGLDALLPHLRARDVTLMCVSRAPIEKLNAYRERMRWGFTWASAEGSEFTADLGVGASVEATREWAVPMLEAGRLPPVARRNARACGVDISTYLAEGYGVDVFTREGDAVYHTYSTTGRGVEFLMGYYPVLDRVPKGRDEAAGFQLWLRRHDDYVDDSALPETTASNG